MPAVSETHLSVYCFPLLGMREPLTPERLRSRHACARLLSRDMKCQNSEQADRLKTAHRAGTNIWRGDRCLLKDPVHFTQSRHWWCRCLLAFFPSHTQSFVLDYSFYVAYCEISIFHISFELLKSINANTLSMVVRLISEEISLELPSTPDEPQTN